MAKPGRPSKFTDEAQALVIEAIVAGSTKKTASEYAGISYSLLKNWMLRGRLAKPGDEAYVIFLADLKKALSKAKVISLEAIRSAGQRHWQAHAWWLERLYPEEFGLDKDIINEFKKFLRERKFRNEEALT